MHIKRTLTFIEEIAEEVGQRVDPPLRKVAVAAIIDNPFAGRFHARAAQGAELRQGRHHRRRRRAGARRIHAHHRVRKRDARGR